MYGKKFKDFYWKIEILSQVLRPLRIPFFCEELSSQETNVIGVIGEFGKISMKDLSEKTFIKPNTLTGIVSKLQDKKILTRYEGEDRRVVIIDFDPEWQKTYETYNQEQEEISEVVFKNIGEEKLEMLAKLISETTGQLEEITTMVKRSV